MLIEVMSLDKELQDAYFKGNLAVVDSVKLAASIAYVKSIVTKDQYEHIKNEYQFLYQGVDG
ncbi:MAG: hypothetical protein GY928_17660 [Colwellia sp.]|nr:hypothetical protein [Colwellia sp.]